MKKYFPYILVFIQLSSLLFIFVTGHVVAESPHGMLVEAAGIFFGLLAIYYMKLGNFRITPLIQEKGILVENGPYHYIRHPMYLAQIVAVAPLVVDYFSFARLAVLVLLCVVLVVKTQFEERLLLAHFSGYAAYKTKTWKMIPLVY